MLSEKTTLDDVCRPKQGAFLLLDDWSPIDIWYLLHRHADIWITSSNANCEKIDGTDAGVIRSASSIQATRWSALCAAAGWTVYGAVALSWCEGAKLEDVWAGWLASGFPLKPLPQFERPARFINPALLPQTNKSGEINKLMKETSPDGNTYQLAVSAAIAALKEPLEFELEPEQYKDAMPQIAAFLKSRMLQKSDRTDEENAIVDVWSETIKGTQWDVWAKEIA